MAVGTMLRPAERIDTSGAAGGGHPLLTPRRSAAVALLLLETTALLVAGAPWISSSATGAPVTNAVVQLRRTVQGGTIGFDAGGCLGGYPDVGVLPNANILYGLHQLDVYDASTPAALFTGWQAQSGAAAGVPFFYEFCPQITTSRLGRLYGVGWVLGEPVGQPRPARSGSGPSIIR